MPSDSLLLQAKRFQERLTQIRSGQKVDFAWYPYDSLANIAHLENLLGPDPEDLFRDLAMDGPVADIGCADGDLSFFLEDLGAEVDAIDNPLTNHNAMRGVRRLASLLGSGVEIRNIDLDQQFYLPRPRYGLILCFGLLYHLKNPYYFLETLSRSCRHMLLSARVTTSIPGVNQPVEDVSLAYFLRATELNQDNSNYWIMTPRCLTNLLERTRWRVERSQTVMRTTSSDPISVENDQRVFLLLRSMYGRFQADLEYGWHEPENEGWRWTMQQFAVRVKPHAAGQRVKLAIYIPDALMRFGPPLRLEAAVNGTGLGEEVYRQPGDQLYARTLPPWQGPEGSLLEFRLSRALPADETDDRERGVIVSECGVEPL
jgi:2-polyprenyl-3-methyl-5-hydroxy-6-metoxy-1,4-benzoquinol methylase